MGTYNHVTLVGYIYSSIQYTEKDENVKKQVADFKIACDRYTPMDAKTKKQETDIFNIRAFGTLADICNEHLKEGKKVLIDGRIQIRSYMQNDNDKIWITEIIADNIKFLTDIKKE